MDYVKKNFSSCKKAITKPPLNMKKISEPQKAVFGQKQFLKIDSTWWEKKNTYYFQIRDYTIF